MIKEIKQKHHKAKNASMHIRLFSITFLLHSLERNRIRTNISCVYRIYGAKTYVDKMKELIDSMRAAGHI